MPSDTESNTSSASFTERKRSKISKKSKKHKKEKKKSRKEKKRARKECTLYDKSTIKPIAPPRSEVQTENEDNLFGAALPPHLLKSTNLVIGPSMPKNFSNYNDKKYTEDSTSSEIQDQQKSQDENYDVMGLHGPLPTDNESEMSIAQVELEKRALELKMAAIDGSYGDKNEEKVREEWMLELPDVGLKSGLAALNNLKRGFYQGKDKPDFTDRSSWTRTPQSDAKPGPSKTSQEDLQSHAQKQYEKQRDAEQEALAKKHKKKYKRDESLVEMHQKKLRKEEKRKAKELKKKGEKPERRPFSRDIDLKLNKIDSNQTKQIVDKAKILDTKFSSGHAKYL